MSAWLTMTDLMWPRSSFLMKTRGDISLAGAGDADMKGVVGIEPVAPSGVAFPGHPQSETGETPVSPVLVPALADSSAFLCPSGSKESAVLVRRLWFDLVAHSDSYSHSGWLCLSNCRAVGARSNRWVWRGEWRV